MILLDSSFAIEWLLGTKRVEETSFKRKSLGILAAQYSETMIFFLKRSVAPETVAHQLEGLELVHPTAEALQLASKLYLEARAQESKASLADAILAAVATLKNETVLSFDQDFKLLGLKANGASWSL